MSIATLERIGRSRTKSFLEREFPSGAGAAFVTVTPRIAGELLDNNPDNRSVSRTKIAQYASDMGEGRWAVNGESIVVAGDGTLIDGQHRLMACVMAGKPFETLLCFGVRRDTRTTIDQGRARTVGDYLTMSGTPNAKMIAAIAKRALAFERSEGRSIEGKFLTAAEVLQYRDENEARLAEAATYANSFRRSFAYAASPSYIGLWHYLLADGGQLGLEYLHQVLTGEGLHEGDPALTVRTRLFQMGRASVQAKTEAVLRGWAYYRAGKSLYRVQLMGEFPEL